MVRGVRDLVDRSGERGFVSVRWLGKAAKLSNELEGRGANLVIRRRRLKIMQSLNVSAHKKLLPADCVDAQRFVCHSRAT